MADCKSVKTPLAAHFKLSSLQCPKSDEEKDGMSKVSYANAVGVYDVCNGPDQAKYFTPSVV